MGPVLAAVLAGALAAAPADSVAVLPVEFTGEAEAYWREQFDQAAREGVSRARFAAKAIDASTCEDATCWANVAREAGATYVMQSAVEVVEVDYTLRVALLDARGSEVSAATRRCELCGAKEAVEAFEDLVASMRTRVEALSAATPTLAITTSPAGAEVDVDGEDSGRTPLELPLTPGAHRIVITLDGYAPRELEWNAVAGVSDRRTLELTPLQPRSARRSLRLPGALLLGGGLALLAPGAALLAIDGRPVRRNCVPDVNDMCPRNFATLEGGIALVATGAAATIIGVVLLVVDARRRRASPTTIGRRLSAASYPLWR